MKLIDTIIEDSKRYGGRNFIKIWLRDPRFRAVLLLRIGCSCNLFWLANRVFFLRVLKNRLALRYGIDTGFNVKIGPGLKIVHLGGIVIHERAVIGANFTIMNNVTIGQKNSHVHVPIIGNNVRIGVFSAVLGKIRLGNNVVIGSHTLVNSSFDDYAKLIGVPARNIN